MKKYFVLLLMGGLVYACGGGSNNKEETGKKAASSGDLVQNQQGLELIGQSDCITCHKLNEKSIGPSYQDVANKYKNDDATIEMLIDKIIQGGEGNWGPVPMTPHPDLSREDAKEMVRFIMSMKKN